MHMPLLVESALVILSVLVAGQVSLRLGQPSVLGQLLAGVLLGPALLGWLRPTAFIQDMAAIGAILLMFLAGLETDAADIRRSAWAAFLVAAAGVALPVLGGRWLAFAWGYGPTTAVFVGVMLAATSVSISVQTLRELGHLHGRPGATILAAAVLDDVLGILVLSVVLGASGSPAGTDAGTPLGSLLLWICSSSPPVSWPGGSPSHGCCAG